jgi:hypothetical protein
MKTEKEKQDLDKDYQKSMTSFSPEMVKKIDMFTFRYFTYYFAAILVFYTILSTFLEVSLEVSQFNNFSLKNFVGSF